MTARRELEAAGSANEAALADLSPPLVRYLLFADEAPLVPGMVGESPFAADFAAAGKRDSAGRSLRDLEGKTRLLAHRCSYLIYSPAFTGLADALRQRVLKDLAAALDGGAAGAHLPAEERADIRQILTGTLPEFAMAATERR